MSASSSSRAAVLIDVSNAYYAGKATGNAKLNYKMLMDALSATHKIVRAIAYVMQCPDIDQAHFLNALASAGFEVRSRIQRELVDDQWKPSNCKVMLAVDAVALAEKMETIVLVAGDSDYVPLVDCIRAKGRGVEVLFFERGVAAELQRAANAFQPIPESWTMRTAAPTTTPRKKLSSRYDVDYAGLPKDDDATDIQ